MRRFDSGEALAREFGLAPAVLKKTFDDYNQSVRTKKDPFGKKVHLFPSFPFQCPLHKVLIAFSVLPR